MTNAAPYIKPRFSKHWNTCLMKRGFTSSPDFQLIFILIVNLGEKRKKLNVSLTHKNLFIFQ